jgi:hypothetical protein
MEYDKELDNFNDYYDRISELVQYADWESSELLAELLSCQDSHSLFTKLQIYEIDEEYPRRKVVSTIFDDFVDHHCRTLYHLSRNEYEDAFSTQLAVRILMNLRTFFFSYCNCSTENYCRKRKTPTGSFRSCTLSAVICV